MRRLSRVQSTPGKFGFTSNLHGTVLDSREIPRPDFGPPGGPIRLLLHICGLRSSYGPLDMCKVHREVAQSAPSRQLSAAATGARFNGFAVGETRERPGSCGVSIAYPANLYPKPSMVRMNCGFPGSASSLRRKLATWTSTVRVNRAPRYPQTSLRSSLRDRVSPRRSRK